MNMSFPLTVHSIRKIFGPSISQRGIIAIVQSLIPVLLLTGCKDDDQGMDGPVPQLEFTLCATYPHDTSAYTEGLIFYNDSLFESTGSPYFLPHCRSVLGPVNLATGRIDVRVELDKDEYFGEGIAYLQGKFYQVTYKNKTGFIYDAYTYKTIGQFSYLSDEAWGLTTDGQALIMSDGTDILTYIDPQTFLVTRFLSVTENGMPKRYLNELEFIDGCIYANVWLTSYIVKIDTSDGRILASVDLQDLRNEAKSKYSASREMNGIAFDPDSGRIFITGKCWPEIYQIELKQ
jgi:glutaminyl-peptide cyclotransferase